jgi:hypothetical protein
MSNEQAKSLVGRLRCMAQIGWNPIGDEAADRIQALEQENARLREALDEHCVSFYHGHYKHPGKSLYVCDICDGGGEYPEEVKHQNGCALAAQGGEE